MISKAYYKPQKKTGNYIYRKSSERKIMVVWTINPPGKCEAGYSTKSATNKYYKQVFHFILLVVLIKLN